MGRRIELPQLPAGQPQEQLQALYSYLYQMAEALNSNLAEIGGNDLTDQERMIVRDIIGTGEGENGRSEAETLKSLIIKTADFVRSELNEYRLNLLGEYVAEGKFGKYVRRTGLDVDVTPTGIQQNYTFQEIIQGLKTYEINAKNYIKTGLLRTVDDLPVYGVAIGKDVVTFSEDGTETYNDGNKVAELTADELSFWQNGNKLASYTGTVITMYSGTSRRMTIDGDGIKFYNGSTLIMTVAAGKITSETDLEIGRGKRVMVGDWDVSKDGIMYKNDEDPFGFEISRFEDKDNNTTGLFYRYYITPDNNEKVGEIQIGVCSLDDNDEVKRAYFRIGTEIEANNRRTKYIVPHVDPNNPYDSYIGSTLFPFNYGAIERIYASEVKGLDNHNLILAVYNEGHGCNLQLRESIVNNRYRLNLLKGATTDEMVFYGDVIGKVLNKTTSETDLNNITEQGTYIIGFSAATNKPSDLASGSFPLEVIYYTTGYVYQRITTNNAIYTRSMSNGSWLGWYKFTGTAV